MTDPGIYDTYRKTFGLDPVPMRAHQRGHPCYWMFLYKTYRLTGLDRARSRAMVEAKANGTG